VTTNIRLVVLGSRGSIPVSGADFEIYGGNTTSFAIVDGDRLIGFVDAGTGLISYQSHGLEPAASIDLFLTHYHWDHIHGFPFFSPAYVPGNHFTIYGQPHENLSVRDILSGQMAMPYFPVPIDAMQAKFTFKDALPGMRIKVGKAVIKTELLNHPGMALSYRIEHDGKSIVYASDTEHGSKLDERLVRHAKGADILIYDASYTIEEYNNGRQGWGHSIWQEGVKVAKAAGVRKLLLFHHEPCRNDSALLTIEKAARREFRATFAAREGKLYLP